MKQEDLKSVGEEGQGEGSNAERDVVCFYSF